MCHKFNTYQIKLIRNIISPNKINITQKIYWIMLKILTKEVNTIILKILLIIFKIWTNCNHIHIYQGYKISNLTSLNAKLSITHIIVSFYSKEGN